MRRALPWVLLLALVASSLWLWQSKPASDEPTPLLLGPEGDDFDEPARLVFAGPLDSIVVEQRGGTYWVVHPVLDLANDFRIRQTVRGMQRLAANRLLADADPVRYGLAPGTRRFEARTPAGATWGLVLGDSAVVSAEVYARRVGPGTPVVMIDRFGARRDFYPDLIELRDPVALPLPRPVVDSIAVVTRTGDFRAARVQRDLWLTRGSGPVRLDPARINRLIRHLRTGNIRGYADESLADRASLGLDPPRALWVFYQGSRADTVRIGHPLRGQEAVWCIPARRDLVAQLASDFYRDFVDGLDALRDRHLLGVAAESVQVVEMLAPEALRFRRAPPSEGGEWLRVSAGDVGVRDLALPQDLENLAALQWRPTPEPSWSPVGPQMAIRVSTEARAETLWMAASPVDTLALARSSLRPQWSVVPPLSWRVWSHRAAHRHAGDSAP